jgi:hypothetical protein
MSTNGNALPAEEQTVHLAGPEGIRLRFSGPPRNLIGAIPLVNTGTDKKKVRSLTVKSEKLQGPARLPLQQIPFYARLSGGEQASVPASFALDPQTAPGSYDFELTVGSRTLPATADVDEIVDLRINPAKITILAGAATSYTRTINAENHGNVPLPTGAQCDAPLFDSYDLVSSMLMGLHKGDPTSAESLAKAFLSEWAQLQVGTLITKRKAITISPGQKVAVDTEFVLPANLKPLRHYHANLQLYNAWLSVEIYTSANYGTERGSGKSKQPA